MNPFKVIGMILFFALAGGYYFTDQDPGFIKYLFIAGIFGLLGVAYLIERLFLKKLACEIAEMKIEETESALNDLDSKQKAKVQKIIEKLRQNQLVHDNPDSASLHRDS